MRTGSVFVEPVIVGERLRSIDAEKVAALVESIAAIGLQQPISVWAHDRDTVHLVAGLHRLEAFKRLRQELADEADLKWDEIPCIFVDMDDLDRQLWEIDENLIRAELTDLERANHTARRAEIVKYKAESAKLAEMENNMREKAESLIAQNEPKVAHRPSKGQVAFVEETASMTGKSAASVKRDKRRGEKITPEVKDAIKDMPAADKGVELDALASLEPDEQAQAVERVKSGASTDFREAKNFIKGDEPSPSALEFERLKKAWQKAGGEARDKFLAWISQDYEKAAGQ